MTTKIELLEYTLDWLLNEGHTPYLVALTEGCDLPDDIKKIDEGQTVVLNISPAAVRDFTYFNGRISFDARINGASHRLSIPVANVTALSSRETAEGLVFRPDETEAAPDDKPDIVKPDLKIIT